jgi:predicted ATPase/DNA-binding SARP family transcriptional activator
MALAHPRSRLEIRLLGEPRFYVDGALHRTAIPAKAILLLCVLALKADQPVDRTKLAYTLWPDDAEDEAKAKLRRHLHLLGRAIGTSEERPQIVATNTTLTWKRDGPCSVDVVDFESLIASGDREGASALYTGDLLPNFYEDWLEAPRRRLRDVQLQNLLALAEQYSQRDDAAKTLDYGRRALRIDPWREDAIRYVVQARTRLGDRSGAMQEYTQFVTRLREEFGAEPLAETQQAFEALKTAEPASTNLPLETTTFIGRKAQLQMLKALLQSSRMVTVTGPGGVGKSRTAVHCARELLSSFRDGIWLIQAGAMSSEDELIHTIAAVMHFHEPPHAPNIEALTQRLRVKHALLLFDNVEGFLDVCARVCAALLSSCEHLAILATSREPLAVTGEAIIRLAPFDEDDEAVRLFCDRARSADAGFAAEAQDGSAVVEICRRLDRLPLALELAAARVAAISPQEILERLHDRFALLKRARVPEVRHHQTLHATIAWSHDLLSTDEKTLLRRMAIFPGAFKLTAIEDICSDETLMRSSVLDTLSRLVDKSLVTAVLARDGRRYRFLDSIREFALGQLYASADAERLRDRYLQYYKTTAQHAAKDLDGPAQHEWLQLLQEEVDNIRAALRFGEIDRPHAADGLDIACALHQFWLIRGYFAEGRRWIECSLELAGDDVPAGIRADALSAAALLAFFSSDGAAAQDLEQRALRLRHEMGDAAGVARSVHSLGYYSFDVGNYDRARGFFSEALAAARGIGDEALAAKSLDNVGLCAIALNDFDAARPSLEESLALYRQREDAYGTAWVLSHLAWLAERTRDYDAALQLHDECLGIRERLGDRNGIAGSCLAMARCFEARGERERAQSARWRSIAIWREVGYTSPLTEVFENYGYAEAARGDPHRAAVLLGAAAHLRGLLSKELPSYERGERDCALAQIESAIGRDALSASLQEGAAMSLDRLVAFALGD